MPSPLVRRRGVLALGLSLLWVGCKGIGGAAPPQAVLSPIPDSTFGRLVQELSEPGGYFDTDNLISNERSYLHVVDALRERRVSGGAYLGVGPDQSFSYIAALRPRVAFLIDIRRDNMLEHLLFKALFRMADTRVEYLSLLHGRRPPPDPTAWSASTVAELAAWVDSAPMLEGSEAERMRFLVDSLAGSFGVPLTEGDLSTLVRFHGAFVAEGLSLRFNTHGRAPQPYYPTFRELLLETDLAGEHSNYLASEEAYRFLEEMQRQNLIIPVVGDLAGPHALRAIGAWLRGAGETVSALYVSNVEFYLFGDGSFAPFADNVLALPLGERAVLIRSYFPGPRGRHPHAVDGYHSTQSLQTLESFSSAVRGGGYGSYWELVTRDALDPRPAGVP